MRDILARVNEAVLAQVAWSNVLLGFDYDGTLAPIVQDPAAAEMRARTRELLARLTKLYPCVVISGRAQEDVTRRVGTTGVHAVIGNHGLEPWRRGDLFTARARSWLPALDGLEGLEGVWVEDKHFSLAIHYRRAPRKKVARAAIMAVAARLEGARVIGGKDVVNLVPCGAPHKGMALEAARDRLGCDTALYVGDDETDEDVFGLDDPGRLLTVRVGAKGSSRAAIFLRNQRAIDGLLAQLIALRPKQAMGAAGS
jgi:trehalose 6-phosphate phosphatase